MENWIWFILIGLAAGFLAGAVIKGHGFGILDARERDHKFVAYE